MPYIAKLRATSSAIQEIKIASNLGQTGFCSLLRVQQPRIWTVVADADRDPVIPEPISTPIHQDLGDQVSEELFDGSDHKVDGLVIDACVKTSVKSWSVTTKMILKRTCFL